MNAQQLSYRITTTPPTDIVSGATVTLPSANVGDTSSVTIQIANFATVNVTLSNIGVGLAVPALPTAIAIAT